MLASAAAADDTAHSSSDDDSYALPVLSSYALALLSADGNNNNSNSNSNDIGASSGDSRSRRTSYDPEQQQLHQSKYLQSTSALVNAARERRKSREASNSPYTASAGSAPRTRFREDPAEINSNSNNADQPTRKLSGSPESFVAATPHHRAGAESTEFRSSENGGAGSGSRVGLVTPAFTRPTLGSHGEPPTSQYRSIFRKSKPGRLGPPKRALRRESQEGENDGVPVAKSPSASPNSKENSKDDEHELRRTIDEAGGNSAGRLRFSAQDEEIPRGDTYWSSRSSREYTSASSKESEQHRTSISSGEISRLEIRDQAHSRTTSPRSSGSPRKALSPKTINDDLHNELRQQPLHRSSPFNYGIEERRHHASSPYEAAKELTSLIHKSLTPKHPPPTSEALAPSPVIQSFVVAGNGYAPESPIRLVSEKKPLYENVNPTPFTESHREEKHHHHRQVFSPLNKDENPRQQRPLAADIYHDEPPRANQAHSNPRSSHSSRLVGRQLLTPLSSNIIRPVRTSTPPLECNIYDPPPKMSNLDIPRPTPKVASKKQKNTVVIAGRAYQRLELIGKGGSSKVFKVQLLNSTKVFALKKVTFDEVDEAVVKGFKGEIELLRKLSDEERVVKLVDFEILDGFVNMVMECGEIDLAHVLAARLNSPLDIPFVRFHTIEMLKCVEAVHRHDIVHSDLKPANFLFVKGMLKIIDFGIANAVPDYTSNVRRETQMGTPNYMAPETMVDVSLVEGKRMLKVGRPSDVWSCGCIIYQMIYGRPPYAAYSGTQRMLAILNPKIEIQYPETGLGGVSVPKEVITTIKGCLDRNPERRSRISEVLDGEFLKPRAISKEILRSLIVQSVQYGVDQHRKLGEGISSRELEGLTDDVWRKIGQLTSNT